MAGRMDGQRLCVLLVLLCSVFSISQGQDECVDKNKYCKDWSQKGNCKSTSTYYEYMKLNCKKSCDLCAAGGVAKPKPKPKPKPWTGPPTPGPPPSTPAPRPGEVDGGWGKWSEPSKCSKSCGGGRRVVTRKCDNPTPSKGGRRCRGDAYSTYICNLQPCPENCYDKSRNCASWATSGYCTKPKYKRTMTQRCPLACRFCKADTSCRDMSGDCVRSKKLGYCTTGSYVEWMKTNCKKTCGLC